MRYLPLKERDVSSSIARALLLTAAVCALNVGLTPPAQAQDATVAYQSEPATVGGFQTPSPAQAPASADTAASTVPPFDWGASVNAGESYSSNATGVSGAHSDDYISNIGANAFLHERSRRVTLDANYTFAAYFYARGTAPTQISNDLEVVGSIQAIPDYLVINAKAFAAPVVTSNLGIVTAGSRIVPNGYNNSFGYYVQPDLKFRLGHFALAETTGNIGGTYFSSPAGSTPIFIPGLPGPQDTTTRAVTQTFTSGEDFETVSWTIVGDFSETDRKQGLLSEKSGIANLRYAFSHEFSLLGSFGYDGISNTVPLLRDVSSPVIMGGFSLTLGQDFQFQGEAGEKYNGESFLGSLSYCLSPKSSIVGSANDTISTPEGQLQNGLANLTSTPSGEINSSNNLLCNGTSASLASYSPQSLGNLSYDQNVARYQTVSLSFLQDFDRNHAAVMLYGTRRTILGTVFVGTSRTDTWGGQITLSRDFTPVLTGTMEGGYYVDSELGGTARNFTANAQLNYSLSRQMGVYLQGYYLDRQSSASLSILSPYTGSLNEYRITVGLSRML